MVMGRSPGMDTLGMRWMRVRLRVSSIADSQPSHVPPSGLWGWMWALHTCEYLGAQPGGVVFYHHQSDQLVRRRFLCAHHVARVWSLSPQGGWRRPDCCRPAVSADACAGRHGMICGRVWAGPATDRVTSQAPSDTQRLRPCCTSRQTLAMRVGSVVDIEVSSMQPRSLAHMSGRG